MLTEPVAPSCAQTPEQDQHEEHRSRREQYALRTIKADFTCRVVLIIVRLFTIRMALRLLGNDRYGLWLTAGSILTWVNLSQAGFGGGLVNEIGKAYANNDRALMRRYISTAYCSFSVVSVLAFLGIAGISHTSFVTKLLGLEHSPGLLHDGRVVFLISGALVAATILVNTIVPICAGLQKSYFYLGFTAFGNLCSLGVLAFISYTGASLPTFTWAIGLPPLLLTVGLTVYFFSYRYKDLAPEARLFDMGSFRVLLSFGVPLLLAQCADLTIFNSANPLIASRLGLFDVPLYSVPFSLFMVVVNLCEGIVRAYWGAYCEACARQDWSWIRKMSRRIRLVNFTLIGTGAAGIVIFGPFAIRVWAGKTVVPSTTMLACMAVYCCLMVCSNTNTVLLLGLGRVKLKAACQLFVAATHIVGFFVLVPRLGLLAIPVAGIIGYLGDVLVSYTFTYRFLHSRLKGSVPMPTPVTVTSVV